MRNVKLKESKIKLKIKNLMKWGWKTKKLRLNQQLLTKWDYFLDCRLLPQKIE